MDCGKASAPQGLKLIEGRVISDYAMNVLFNGYPHKTAAQLGVSNDTEAYYATQLAFWIAARPESRKGAVVLNLNDVRPNKGMESFYNNSAAAARRILANAKSNPYRYAKASMSIDQSKAKRVQKNGKLVFGPYYINEKNLVESVKISLQNAPASAKLSKQIVNAGEPIYVEINEREQGSQMSLVAESAGMKYIGRAYHSYPSNMQDYAKIQKVREPVSSKIDLKWDTLKGKINVIKVDQNNERIVGVGFELQKQDGTKVAEAITDENGVVSFDNILPGKYKLVEIKGKEGYIKNDKPLEFDVEPGKTFEIQVENKKILGKLKIIKKDNIEKKPIKGVKFVILNEQKEKVDEIITDEKGEAISKELPIGKYTYKEVEVKDIYEKDEKEYPFEITKPDEIIEKQIENILIQGELELLKIDKDTKEPIQGVQFRILDENKKEIEVITTNEKGIAKSSKLGKGKYYFEEIKAKEGYINNSKKYKFEITKNGELIKETITNAKKTLPITGGLGTNIVIFLSIAGVSVGGYFLFKKYFN